MEVELKKVTQLSKENFETIVDWMYNWWGKEEKYSKKQLRIWLSNSLHEDKIPMTFGLFQNDKIIGMYQFVNNDFFIRPDIYPWLSNVYIDEHYRSKGYSKLLLNSVKDNLPNNLVGHELYLYTKHTKLYEKYGWKFVEEIDTFQKNDRVQRLYKLDL